MSSPVVLLATQRRVVVLAPIMLILVVFPLKKIILVSQRINKYTLKTHIGVIKAPPPSSVMSLAAAQGWGVVLATVAPVSVVFPL